LRQGNIHCTISEEQGALDSASFSSETVKVISLRSLKLKEEIMKKFVYLLVCLQSFLLTSTLFAAEEAEPMPPRDQGLWQTVFMIAIALIFFYFILWRPEQKRRKVLEDQRNALKKGDRVTAMGIIGTVLRIQDQSVILKMYDGSKIEVLKGAITDVLSGTEEDAKKAEKEERSSTPKKADNDEE
jgi:preprotein translocase subunit YajC